jgi:hypothetical protein
MVDEAIVGEKGTVGGQDWSWGVGCGNELNAWGGERQMTANGKSERSKDGNRIK